MSSAHRVVLVSLVFVFHLFAALLFEVKLCGRVCADACFHLQLTMFVTAVDLEIRGVNKRGSVGRREPSSFSRSELQLLRHTLSGQSSSFHSSTD